MKKSPIFLLIALSLYLLPGCITCHAWGGREVRGMDGSPDLD